MAFMRTTSWCDPLADVPEAAPFSFVGGAEEVRPPWLRRAK